MSEGFYPKAPKIKVEDAIDKSTMAAEMIQLMVDGAEANYFGNGDADIGKRLDVCHITGIVQHGKNSPVSTRALWDEVQAEMKAMRKVDPSKFTSEANYKAELVKVKGYSDETKWVDGMKAEKGVSMWSDLKAAYTTVEEV